MKYRRGFVTNSSSTNFGAAGASALIGAILGILGSCDNDNSDSKDNDGTLDLGILRTAKMPSDGKIIEGSTEPVYVYAQFLISTEKGEVVLPEVTSSIEFSVQSGSNWISLGNKVSVEDWVAIDVYGITSELGDKPPKSVTIVAEAIFQKKKYRKKIKLAFEAKPQLVIKPDKLSFLSKTGETSEVSVSVSCPANKQWSINFSMDSLAEKLCSYDFEVKSKLGDKGVLTITENDTVDTDSTKFTSYYDTGKITVTATDGEIEISDYLNVTVFREGLYIQSGLSRDTGYCIVKGDKNEKGEMIVSELDLVYLKWDKNQKRVVSKSQLLEENLSIGDVETSDTTSQNVFEGSGFEIKYDRIRPSNISSAVYKLNTSYIVPGKKGESFKGNIPAYLTDEDKEYAVNIPVEIRPAYLSETSSWKQEYENCIKIIKEFMPKDVQDKKIKELEERKDLYGVEDLKRFRKECWDIAYNALTNEAQSLIDDAKWYDKAIYYAEWTQWIGDRAFSGVVGTLTGPIGAYAVTQIRDTLIDLISKMIYSKSKNWYEFAMDYLSSRFQGISGNSIDAVVTNDPSLSIQWVSSFFLYKFVWHWYWDVDDDSGQRKGVVEALKSATFDLTALGIEKALEPYIKSSATKKGWAANEKLDEWVKKQVEAVKFAISFYSDGAV